MTWPEAIASIMKTIIIIGGILVFIGMDMTGRWPWERK